MTNNILHTDRFNLEDLQELIKLLHERNYWVNLMTIMDDPSSAMIKIEEINLKIKTYLNL